MHGHSRDPKYFDATCAQLRLSLGLLGDGYHTLYSCTYTQNESCVISAACTTW